MSDRKKGEAERGESAKPRPRKKKRKTGGINLMEENSLKWTNKNSDSGRGTGREHGEAGGEETRDKLGELKQ